MAWPDFRLRLAPLVVKVCPTRTSPTQTSKRALHSEPPFPQRNQTKWLTRWLTKWPNRLRLNRTRSRLPGRYKLEGKSWALPIWDSWVPIWDSSAQMRHLEPMRSNCNKRSNRNNPSPPNCRRGNFTVLGSCDVIWYTNHVTKIRAEFIYLFEAVCQTSSTFCSQNFWVYICQNSFFVNSVTRFLTPGSRIFWGSRKIWM